MNKSKVNFWLDVLLLGLLVTVIFTGFSAEPSSARLRYRGGAPVAIRSPSIDQLRSVEPAATLHTLGTLALIGNVIVHLILHRSWLRAVIRRRHGGNSTQLTTSVGLVILLAVSFVLTGLSGLLHLRGVHEFCSVVMIAIIAAHLVVHRKWIVACAQRYLIGHRRSTMDRDG